jgi:hypothetical protein
MQYNKNQRSEIEVSVCISNQSIDQWVENLKSMLTLNLYFVYPSYTMSQFYQFVAPKGSAALEACYGPQEMRAAVAAERKAYEQGQTEVLWWLLLCLERARRTAKTCPRTMGRQLLRIPTELWRDFLAPVVVPFARHFVDTALEFNSYRPKYMREYEDFHLQNFGHFWPHLITMELWIRRFAMQYHDVALSDRIDVSMQATALMTLYYAAVWRPQFSTRKSWKQHMVEYSNTNAPAYYARIVAYLRRPCPLQFVHLVFRNLHRVTNTMTDAHIFIDMLETYVQCH